MVWGRFGGNGYSHSGNGLTPSKVNLAKVKRVFKYLLTQKFYCKEYFFPTDIPTCALNSI